MMKNTIKGAETPFQQVHSARKKALIIFTKTDFPYGRNIAEIFLWVIYSVGGTRMKHFSSLEYEGFPVINALLCLCMQLKKWFNNCTFFCAHVLLFLHICACYDLLLLLLIDDSNLFFLHDVTYLISWRDWNKFMTVIKY